MGYTKIEFVYGERVSGKTKEIVDNINEIESIGIVCVDYSHAKALKNRIGRKLDNVKFLIKYDDCYGNHFDKVYLDDANHLNVKHWLLKLSDNMTHLGGKIIVYFIPPSKYFSTRIINKL